MQSVHGIGDGDWGVYHVGAGVWCEVPEYSQYYAYGFGLGCITGYGGGATFGGYDGKQGCGRGDRYGVMIEWVPCLWQ
jgi:hypothetical protein